MKSITTKKTIMIALMVVIVLFVFCFSWFLWEYNHPRDGLSTGTVFEIERGSSASLIARKLKEENIIKKKWPFLTAYRLYYPKEKLIAGEYEFNPPLSVKEVLKKILKGNMVSHLDTKAQDLEGYLFPETYHIPKNTSEAELIEMMVDQFRKTFVPRWEERAKEMGMEIRDIVTLASLIEEETSVPEEKPLVSSVFHNRLKLGMKLDCDPTIIYALKKKNGYLGRLRNKDLKLNSPYNTYLHNGLPPGPISNPGQESLKAALCPSETDYLYFVSKNDGTHKFSSTFKEHQRAVIEFQIKK